MTTSIAPGETEAPHIHRWKIASPDGPTSAAGCTCGAERSFRNGWDQDNAIPGAWDRHGLHPAPRTRQAHSPAPDAETQPATPVDES